MPKLKLEWIDCPKCEGDGGWEFGSYDDLGWVSCYLCGGSGRTQKPIRVKEKHEANDTKVT